MKPLLSFMLSVLSAEVGSSTNNIPSFVKIRVGTCGKGGRVRVARGHVHSDTGTGDPPVLQKIW